MKIPNINYRVKSLNAKKAIRTADEIFNSRHAQRHPNPFGLKGVKPQRGRFGASIRQNNIRYWLGTYDTAEEAHAAYIAKLEEMRSPDFKDREPIDYSKFNGKNRKRRNNTSGYTGVRWQPKWRKYTAVIKHKNVTYHLGTFKTALEAHHAYEDALNKFKSEATQVKEMQYHA